MGVKHVLAIREGWKQKDNQRFGACLEVQFIDEATNKVLFRYAPKLEDKDFWSDMWCKLDEFDKKHKELYAFVKRIDPEYVAQGIDYCVGDNILK